MEERERERERDEPGAIAEAVNPRTMEGKTDQRKKEEGVKKESGRPRTLLLLLRREREENFLISWLPPPLFFSFLFAIALTKGEGGEDRRRRGALLFPVGSPLLRSPSS